MAFSVVIPLASVQYGRHWQRHKPEFFSQKRYGHWQPKIVSHWPILVHQISIIFRSHVVSQKYRSRRPRALTHTCTHTRAHTHTHVPCKRSRRIFIHLTSSKPSFEWQKFQKDCMVFYRNEWIIIIRALMKCRTLIADFQTNNSSNVNSQ